MVWFAEKASSVKAPVIHADCLFPNHILQAMGIVDNTSLMRPDSPFQINCFTGKIADSKKYGYIKLNFYIINYLLAIFHKL